MAVWREFQGNAQPEIKSPHALRCGVKSGSGWVFPCPPQDLDEDPDVEIAFQ